MPWEGTRPLDIIRRIPLVLEERAILYAGGDQNAKIHYGELMEAVGIVSNQRAGQYLARYLDLVSDYCARQNMPNLTALVVGQNNRPSQGFCRWGVSLDEALRAIREYDWVNNQHPPIVPGDPE